MVWINTPPVLVTKHGKDLNLIYHDYRITRHSAARTRGILDKITPKMAKAYSARSVLLI
jgi:hypothetical protein